ncbi:BamA/TamA family outer membrane protein [Aliivibrio fischeri]|uniref:BamA/TamA family outer membrane protein n=1 Tax=Aliivibrio fischeri TaxID=668 RepID=UPI0012DA2F6B|nr:BamA/TamA family outer membrane protein [Aliivibrio fischeri]MUJ39226.1 BamA/TamA family outer membrane protein [Aliivibrio fischeri]
MTFLKISTVVLLSCYAFSISAKEEPQSWVDTFLEELGSSEDIDVSQGVDWAVLPGPFANPEQGFGLGIAAVGLYSPLEDKDSAPLSTVSITGYGSSSGSYGIGINNRTYFENDEIRFLVQAKASHTPEYYWGIGKEQAENEGNKTLVEAEIFGFTPKIAYQFYPNTYLLAGFDLESHRKQTTDSLLLNSKDLEDTLLTAATISLEYDSRDFELNAYSGTLLSINWNEYSKSLGSDYEFNKATFNYRQYYRVTSDTVLAWEAYSETVQGDVPWFALSSLGSDKRMRGYYSGQYRDNTQASAQIEVRHQFNQRHGMVAWVGGGNVADSYQQIFDSKWLPTYGVGYRFAFKPRVNVRLDYGIGKDSQAVYFQINEAF